MPTAMKPFSVSLCNTAQRQNREAALEHRVESERGGGVGIMSCLLQLEEFCRSTLRRRGAEKVCHEAAANNVPHAELKAQTVSPLERAAGNVHR